MAKLTIEIDLEDPQESWEALYRRIEQFEPEREHSKKPTSAAAPATYDLLLDPDHNLGELSDFFAVFSSRD
jgi:hypothetical protein